MPPEESKSSIKWRSTTQAVPEAHNTTTSSLKDSLLFANYLKKKLKKK